MAYERSNYIKYDAEAAGVFSTRVYGWMAIGLGFTAAVAFFLFYTGLYAKLLPFWMLFALGTLGVALALNFAIQKLSIGGLIALFMTYAGLEGLLFGTILPVYASQYGGDVIWSAFATGGVIFAIAMLYGLFTKSDLTSLGKILTFALIGLIAVSLIFFVVSFFIKMPLFNLIISYIGLAIFVGLTAFDAQTIRRMSSQVDVHTVQSYKLSMIMALKMYINVIMIFWYLLQIFASGKDRR